MKLILWNLLSCEATESLLSKCIPGSNSITFRTFIANLAPIVDVFAIQKDRKIIGIATKFCTYDSVLLVRTAHINIYPLNNWAQYRSVKL